MPVFRCKLGNESGKIVEEEIDATDVKSLRDRLEREGRLVYEISEKSISLSSAGKTLARSKVKTRELLIFNQEFVALLKAGLPILPSLETLAEKEENQNLKRVLDKVASEVKKGAPLSDAFEGEPAVFKKLYISSVRAGEKSGDIATNIKRYISYIKRVEELKKQIISASIYPVILLTVAIGVVFFLLFYVVPSFSQVFLDSGADLPLPTVILIALTRFLQEYFLLLIAIIAMIVPLFILAKSNALIRKWFSRIKIASPWLGDTIRIYSIAKFSRTMSTILKSGETLVPAMVLAAGTLENPYLEEKLTYISRNVKEGESLTSAMEQMDLMPSTALKMIMVGESSGSLDEMFENIAEFFEEEVDRRLNFITTTIEPVMMLAMGILIAFIVVAMYLPIFKLAGAS
ncbi:MAG: type II secretion system F family protein [Deltaproteobacteria bacterium]|nr:type II secretion system F family protein [Deltaproteobacteria bacterium]